MMETWTPKLVGERLIEAVRWANYAAGQVGPAGIRGGMPSYAPTWEERLAEGWGIPELAGDEQQPDRRMRVPATPAQITAFEAALTWPAIYLLPDHEGSARIMCVWVRCKAARASFDDAVDRRKTISRATAYRLRDRALSIISQGLDRDRVPL